MALPLFLADITGRGCVCGDDHHGALIHGDAERFLHDESEHPVVLQLERSEDLARAAEAGAKAGYDDQFELRLPIRPRKMDVLAPCERAGFGRGLHASDDEYPLISPSALSAALA